MRDLDKENLEIHLNAINELSKSTGENLDDLLRNKMGVSYNGDENKIYWECQKCGHSLNKATVAEISESYLRCEKCNTLHDINISITVKACE